MQQMLRDGEIAVSLSEQDMMRAGKYGLLREIIARRPENQWKNRFEYGDEQFQWGKHVIGAMAELACANALGLEWDAGVNSFRRGDVASRYEVRWSQPKRDRKRNITREARLKVKDDEHPDREVIMVTGDAPHFIVRGWIRAQAAKRPEWWAEPFGERGAYFVPMEFLWPMHSLPGREGDKWNY